MRRHLSYLKYVIRHKWFVYIAARKIRCSLYRAIIHDWSKFLPAEWFPYAETFYKPDGSKQYIETVKFNHAWNHHQKCNKHHWQYWLLRMDRGETIALEMPQKYVCEMVADWMGAGRAITGKWEVVEWYLKNKEKIILHEKTQQFVTLLLFKFGTALK